MPAEGIGARRRRRDSRGGAVLRGRAWHACRQAHGSLVRAPPPTATVSAQSRRRPHRSALRACSGARHVHTRNHLAALPVARRAFGCGSIGLLIRRYLFVRFPNRDGAYRYDTPQCRRRSRAGHSPVAVHVSAFDADTGRSRSRADRQARSSREAHRRELQVHQGRCDRGCGGSAIPDGHVLPSR